MPVNVFRYLTDEYNRALEVLGNVNDCKDFCYAVKFNDGSYWIGRNKWDKQLRKAKLFHSLKYANEVIERFPQHNPKIVKVEIREVQENE